MIRSQKSFSQTYCRQLRRSFCFDENKISRFSLEIPDSLWTDLFKGSKEKPNIEVISLPMDPCLIKIEQVTELVPDLSEKIVLLGIDPTNYLYNKRRYDYIMKKKKENIDDVSQNIDPIYPFSVEEASFDFPVLDYFYRSNMAVDSPVKFKELEKEFSEKHKKPEESSEKTVKGFINNEAFILEETFNKIIIDMKKLSDNKKSKEYKALQKEYNAIFDSMMQLIVWNDNFTTTDMKNVAINMTLFSKANTVYFCGIPEIMMRIIYATNCSSKTLLDDFIAETQQLFDIMLNETSDFDRGVSWDAAVRSYWVSKRSQETWDYTIEFLKEVLKVNEANRDIVIIADSLTCSNYVSKDQTTQDDDLVWQDYTKIYSVADQELKDELIKRHAVLDCILESYLWEKPFIKNQFCYINLQKGQIESNDQKEYQKTFFYTYKKVEQIIQKMKESVQRFERVGITAHEYDKMFK